MKLIIARYNEDVKWADEYEDFFVVQKGLDLPNVGREPSSYVWYIIKNYDSLEGDYCFLQGNPLEHQPLLKKYLEEPFKDFYWIPTEGRTGLVCNNEGHPHDSGMDIRAFLESIGLNPPVNDQYLFNGCALFKVSAERIKSRPKSFYEGVYELLMSNPKNAYVFERVVGLIWGDDCL